MSSRVRNFVFMCFAGAEAKPLETITKSFTSAASAKDHAGRIAKRINGPVDLAVGGAEDWNERYITTASPSEHHAKGYRFERLT